MIEEQQLQWMQSCVGKFFLCMCGKTKCPCYLRNETPVHGDLHVHVQLSKMKYNCVA